MDSIREALPGGSNDIECRYQCVDCDEVFRSEKQTGAGCPACGEERVIYRL